MAKTTLNEGAGAPHSITLNDRKEMVLTGVSEVISFDEELIQLKTGCGAMRIEGKQMHVRSLLLEDGRLQISGQVNAISYIDRKLRSAKTVRELFR